MINDQQHQYGAVSRFFHWFTAILVLWQFAKFFDRINDGEHWVGETLVPYHINIGAFLLVLVIARMIWAFTQLSQRPVNPQAANLWSKLGHISLYGLLTVMPLLGICKMVGNGYGLKVFGCQLVERGTEIAWMAQLGELHSPVAWLLLLAIVGHIVMAVKHHLCGDKQLLRSMV